MAERRREPSPLNERVAALETKLDIVAVELGRVRIALHTANNHLGILLAHSEQQKLDHANQATQLDRFSSHLGQHDQRDDQRFAGVGSQITTLEKQFGVRDSQAAEQERQTQRHHDRRNLMHAALIGLIAALVGGFFAGLPLWFGK